VIGALHLGSQAGEPACRTNEPIPRLTSDARIVTCSFCRRTSAFNSALRRWLLRQVRSERDAVSHAAAMGGGRRLWLVS
jgi:hypothetical protein